MHGHVYKSLLRGCLKRPQRNSQNLPGNCSNCEETRKYIKSSIELYRHFSNPALNRRWICRACDTDNNSVTWHCVICDQVSYLAPIYKGQHEATATTASGAGGVVHLELSSVGNSEGSEKHQQHQQQRQSSKDLEEHEEPSQYHSQHSNRRHLFKGARRVVSTSSSSSSHSNFRRTQSLSASIDKASVAASASSASGRSCHICHVNNLSKDIFNLPIETPLNYPHKPSKYLTPSPDCLFYNIFSIDY